MHWRKKENLRCRAPIVRQANGALKSVHGDSANLPSAKSERHGRVMQSSHVDAMSMCVGRNRDSRGLPPCFLLQRAQLAHSRHAQAPMGQWENCLRASVFFGDSVEAWLRCEFWWKFNLVRIFDVAASAYFLCTKLFSEERESKTACSFRSLG